MPSAAQAGHRARTGDVASCKEIDDVRTLMMTVVIPYLSIVGREPLPFFRRAEHRMGMPALSPSTYWTAEMVRAIPDDRNRYECIDGELLVTPAPRWRHQDVVGELYLQLRLWLAQSPLGKVTASPADVEIVPGTLVQPDLFVVPRDEMGALPHEWHDIRAILLAVEVLSPSTARNDRVIKRRFFARAGVPEYWIVDVDARVIERWTLGAERAVILGEGDVLHWSPPRAELPFMLPIGPFFTAIFADHPEI